MLKVIGSVRSRGFRVLWMLEEIGMPYDHIVAGPRSPEALEVNSSGKVPVMVEDGTVITDSTAILTYLADKTGKLTFPAGTLERAKQDALTHFLLDEFDAALWMAARHTFVLPEEMRLPEIKTSLRWEFERSQSKLAERLHDGPFLMGDTMTIADIIATHCGNWAQNAKFPVTAPAFIDYLDRMRARPAFVKTRGD